MANTTSLAPQIADLKEHPIIYVIGSNELQNDLLISFLEKETGLVCKAESSLNISLTMSYSDGRIHVFFIDSQKSDLANLWATYSIGSSANNGNCYIALFNVNPEIKIEREAVDRGVRGIFYNGISLDLFPKGIRTMLSGELWYSRAVLSKFVIQQSMANRLSKNITFQLTSREKEILMSISAGDSNKEIAEKLCISLHTVKTHIYNIYKKINASNRLQAALWAAKYL